MKKLIVFTAMLSFLFACKPSIKWTDTDTGSYHLVVNNGGKTLGYQVASGVKILEAEGFAFKDLNKNGALDPYEDWRLDVDVRAKDLASKLSVEQIAGLMLYSGHQSVPARPGGYFAGTYNGKPYEEGVTDPSDLTDQQKKFLEEDHLRHVLVTTVQSPEMAALWSNKVQAFCESKDMGIPANNSSDPRHGTKANAEYNAAAGGEISMWPTSLGMAASFDPELIQQFGSIASEEYRALGITTALSPQVDMATEPRWARFNGTFGESPNLSAAMARAYCDGFQSSQDNGGNWGKYSVNAMVKHWPGGGSGEAGRDAHYSCGRFAVYPGNNFKAHMIPFTQGAFDLKGATKTASAVMPYYTISWGQDVKNGEQIANNYNSYIIDDLLRKGVGYDGVVCTDWLVTGDHRALDFFLDGKSWGVESLSLAERHYKILKAGVDQFGGNNDAKPVVEAYQLGVAEMGEKAMRDRMEASAVRLLRNIFNVGLFENPYVDVKETVATVGKPEFMKAGFEAQVKSIVMLKNAGGVLPAKKQTTVYVPKKYYPASRNFLGIETPAKTDYPINLDIVKKYFNTTDDPSKADFAIVYIQNPAATIGYDSMDVRKGGNGYIPISLQYGPYTANFARETSIAGGDPLEQFTNRSYKGKTVTTKNITDADLVAKTKMEMGEKPVLMIVGTGNPLIFSEIEPMADAILISFGVQDQALMDIVSGVAEPSALLPMQMPTDMKTVEEQFEDVPYDMVCYKDAQGNSYDFGFGLNWSGVIADERVKIYK